MLNYLITSLYKDKNPLELIADLFIAFMFVMIVSALCLNEVCSGWNEGFGGGSCPISALDGYYQFIMITGTMMSFTAIVWMWFIPIAFIIKLYSVWKYGLVHFAKKYPIDVVVYIPVSGLFLYLIYLIYPAFL